MSNKIDLDDIQNAFRVVNEKTGETVAEGDTFGELASSDGARMSKLKMAVPPEFRHLPPDAVVRACIATHKVAIKMLAEFGIEGTKQFHASMPADVAPEVRWSANHAMNMLAAYEADKESGVDQTRH